MPPWPPNLRRMGATVEERPDGLKVEGRTAGNLRGAEIDPHGDHRIAMAFAVAALAAEGDNDDSGCRLRRCLLPGVLYRLRARRRALGGQPQSSATPSQSRPARIVLDAANPLAAL